MVLQPAPPPRFSLSFVFSLHHFFGLLKVTWVGELCTHWGNPTPTSVPRTSPSCIALKYYYWYILLAAPSLHPFSYSLSPPFSSLFFSPVHPPRPQLSYPPSSSTSQSSITMKAAVVLSFVAAATASLVERGCHGDNCARQVTGTRAGLTPIESRKADCTSFMKATVTPDATYVLISLDCPPAVIS